MRKENFKLPPISPQRKQALDWWYALSGSKRIEYTRSAFPGKTNLAVTDQEIIKMWQKKSLFVNSYTKL